MKLSSSPIVHLKASAFIFAILILFSSCETKHANTATNKAKTVTIKLQPERLSKIKFSDFFSNCKLLSLQTDTAHMIGRISSAIVGNSGKNLLVYNRGSLDIFDSTGHFIFNLKRGKGPGEFSSIASVKIGIPDSVFSFIDIYKQKLYIYGFDGNQKQEINLNIFIDECVPLNDSVYAFRLNQPNGRTKNKLNFLNLKTGKITGGFFPINDKYARFMNLQSQNFFYSGGTLYFVNTPFDTVYNINSFSSAPKPAYFINTGKHRLKKEFLNHDFNNIMDFITFAKRNAYAFGFHHFIQINPFLFFSYSYGNKILRAIFNKQTNKSITLRDFTDDVLLKKHPVKMFNYFYPVGNTKNELIFIADPLQIKEKMDSLAQNLPPAQWLQIQKEHKSLYHIYKNITLKTNPVLLFYKVRK